MKITFQPSGGNLLKGKTRDSGALNGQVGTQLCPVLHERDLKRFDLDRVFTAVQRLAESIGR